MNLGKEKSQIEAGWTPVEVQRQVVLGDEGDGRKTTKEPSPRPRPNRPSDGAGMTAASSQTKPEIRQTAHWAGLELDDR
jgi:hypothetical protein